MFGVEQIFSDNKGRHSILWQSPTRQNEWKESHFIELFCDSTRRSKIIINQNLLDIIFKLMTKIVAQMKAFRVKLQNTLMIL